MAAKDRKMLARWKVATVVCVLLPFLPMNARASDLVGFAEFPFGITADQLKDKIDVFRSDKSADGVVYITKWPRNINGRDFTINFLFRDTKLAEISLDYSADYPNESVKEKCGGDFSQITENIHDRYQVDSRLMISKKATFFASRFEFSHGSRITVYHMIFDDRVNSKGWPECVVRVEYQERPIRNEF
ncbi:MAG: hypothetical protein E5X72_01670 [Mesorhizobium sp.]|uniref:hypothetical protein n=1 Tax=Mesorhizobium sp. TaxID=1871066 RepID=UPI0011F5EB38|nr:hypothetical protein [Mesorhizobium sp.]TIP06452.1 MAG: hypothetical protein E5X72_01670 [Mesorhizobium sp.]